MRPAKSKARDRLIGDLPRPPAEWFTSVASKEDLSMSVLLLIDK